MIERGRAAAARRLRSHWTMAALVFALLAIVHTRTLATEPGTLSRNDNGDARSADIREFINEGSHPATPARHSSAPL